MNVGSIEILMKYLGIQTNTEKQIDAKAKDPFRFFLDKKNYRVYCSLGKVDWTKFKIKALSYALGKRKQQQVALKDDYEKYTFDYTPCIDLDGNQDIEIIDNKEHKIDLEISQEECVERALDGAKAIINVLNKYKVKWFIQFSGTKGFHLFYEIPLDIHYKQKIELANRIKKGITIDTLDLGVVDRYPDTLRKLIKCPYTLETNHGVTRVVLPLDDAQLKNFDFSKTEVGWVLNNIRGLKIRGLIWRNENIYISERLSLFNKLLEDFEIEIPNLEECK